MSDKERDELMLDSMGATPTGFEIKTHAGGPQTAETLLFIADSMRATLDEYEAENYLEMEVKASDGKRYIMTLQRAGKVTPHEARVKAERALEATKPRTITTTEELDDLDADSVLRTKHGTLYTKGRDRDVLLSGVGWFTTSDAIAEERSFTVLYEPAQ